MTKNECCEHGILLKFLQNFTTLISIFLSEKNQLYEFNDEALKSYQIAFQYFFRIKEIIKNDGAT